MILKTLTFHSKKLFSIKSKGALSSVLNVETKVLEAVGCQLQYSYTHHVRNVL